MDSTKINDYQKIIITASIGFIFTIFSNLAIYYFTHKEEQFESLSYWIDPPSSFTKGSSSTIIQTIFITNNGNEKANDIALFIEYPQGVLILDKNIAFSSGKFAEYTDSLLGTGTLKLKSPLLFPNEKIKISFILKSEHYEAPIISLKSNSSIGGLIQNKEKKGNETIDIYFILFMGTMGMLMLACAAIFLFVVYYKRNLAALEEYYSEQLKQEREKK
jgi:hypothetical protein